jgi:DNA-binding IclR family transcriptional regulator
VITPLDGRIADDLDDPKVVGVGRLEPKKPPSYSISSVDHALRLAAALQLEDRLTVSEAAARLGVGRSTAHRLLQMLVYRSFAVQDEQRAYRAGPVLELAAASRFGAARLRAVALPHLERLVTITGESADVAVRIGVTTRFVASVESRRSLRVGSREGMGLPAHQTTAGLVLLAELADAEVSALYTGCSGQQQLIGALRRDLARIRRQRFVVNQGRSEPGIVAIGVPVRDSGGMAIAGLSISMPTVRYDKERLSAIVNTLHAVARVLTAELAT